jgi:hypothetical protein
MTTCTVGSAVGVADAPGPPVLLVLLPFATTTARRPPVMATRIPSRISNRFDRFTTMLPSDVTGVTTVALRPT